jgi:hypothetical protein
MSTGNKKKRVMLPNFLIVGAAKAGTTSLYLCLKQHPDIFMSSLKEPHFITAQFFRKPQDRRGDYPTKPVQDYDSYLRLFEGASGKKAIGEASADNLYHYDPAITYIKKFIGEPRIIIILRNPVDLAFSAYTFLARDNREYLSFEEALDKEEQRKQEGWRHIWLYKDSGFYSNQVRAYMDNFPYVKICLFDDLRKDTLAVVKELYEFLDVDPSFVPKITRCNVSGIPRYRKLHNLFVERTPLQNIIRTSGKFILGEDRWIMLRESVRARLLQKTTINPETRERLKNAYREDILNLQRLIKKDLTPWLN